MADPELKDKDVVVAESRTVGAGDCEKTPDRHSRLEQTHADIDLVRTTQRTPYGDISFFGTYAAAALSFTGCFCTYLLPITSLAILNSPDILGPSPNSTWVALSWTLLSAVSFTLMGRLSDIFGRRWFLAGSTLCAVIGSVIGATATRLDTLIAASVFLGMASAGQLSPNCVIGELVPMRHRFPALVIVAVFTMPSSALGPWIARLFIQRTAVGWRGIYYLGVAIHGVSFVLWVLFYHPPKFENLHRNRSKMDELRDMDFVGIFLFVAGCVLFLLGVSWGGQLYPWTSPQVLCTMIIGFFVVVAFILYEAFVPLRRPLVPMHLFNYGYSTLNILSAMGGMVYYSMSVLFPIMVSSLFETDIVRGGLVSCAVGGGFCAGQITTCLVTVPVGRLKYQLVFACAGMTAFLAGLAGTVDNEGTAIALAVIAGFMTGLLETTVSVAVTIVIDDQSEIGTASGLFGSIRSASAAVATAVYVSILQNKVKSNTESFLVPALVKAGLPATSVPEFLGALAAGQGDALAKIRGVTPEIIQTAVAGFRTVYARSFKTVYLSTIAFGALSLIVAFFVPNIDDKLSRDVVRRLGSHSPPEYSEKRLEENGGQVLEG